MEKTEITGKYLKNHEDTQGQDTWEEPTNIEGLGAAKVDSLKDTVDEIETLIKERRILSDAFIKEGEKMKTTITNFLSESAPTGEDDTEFARERAELRKKQIEISELQLKERVGCWQDISLLKKELRDRVKELSERESRTEAITRILEE